MAAGLAGALEKQAGAVGLNINLPFEAVSADQSVRLDFSYFMGVRKYVFFRFAQAFIFMPGGFGTADELYEVLTLIQTGLLEPKPIYLVGREYWHDFEEFSKRMESNGFIGPKDRALYKIVDDEEPFIEELLAEIAK